LRTYRQPVAQTTSDEQGGFRFDDVPAGAWLVGPRPFAQWNPDASEDRPVGLAQLVRVEASSGTLAVELRVDRGLFIAGVVLDTRDEPVAECSVGVQMDGALVVEHDDTDESGRFRIGPLPAGNYSVRAGGLSKYAPSEPVSAAAGATDVVIHVNPGGSIRVRIVDSQGVLRTSDVILSSSDAQLGWMGTTAENGAALFEGLSSGTYAVIATASDGSFGRRSGLVLDAGTVLDAVEVVLAPGARLLLRYEGADAVANCRITAEGEFVGFGSVERGVESPCVVPPGALEVHWLRPPDGADVIQRVTLQPGEQRELVWDGNP
jgi:hypothetical protein